MATSLGKVGIVDKGNYSSEATYNSGDFVFYEGSTWLALKDALMGIEPVEGENWKYLARGVPDGIATLEQVGVVKPSIDLTIAEDGAIGINTVFESIAERANIESGDTWETVLGKINKYFGDIKPHAFLNKITEEYIDSVITEKINNAVQKSMIANNLVTDNTEMVLAAPMGKLLQDQITEQNKNIVNGYFLRDTVNDRTKIKNTGFYQLTDDIPVSGAEYFAYSFGQQGKHWNYPVFLFNNWGDSVPLRMFQLQSADGQNYTASDYKQIITNSDINAIYHTINYTGNGTNQAFDIPILGYQSLLSSEICMVDGTWEFKLNHCCCNFSDNNIHIDFSSDVNQNYSLRFLLSSYNTGKTI